MAWLLLRLKQGLGLGLRLRVPLLGTHRTTIRRRPDSVRFCSTTSSSATTTDHARVRDEDPRISIGDVSVASPPIGSGRSDLVPDLGLVGSGDNNSNSNSNNNNSNNKIRRLLDALPPSWTLHLRWMLQKDMVLRQDFCVLGPERAAADRRSLVFLYAAVTGREVEYVSLSRDTSDYDLKQRKEVVAAAAAAAAGSNNTTTTSNTATTSTYMHQAPVRAALHGRLLILDGLEKAERNVLPTLNNLLENREMSLDDGSMLVSAAVYDQQEQLTSDSASSSSSAASVKMHRVHPDFCVVALGSMSEDISTSSSVTSLDPPLRSRFQARLQAPLDPGELLQAVAATSNGRLDEATLKELVYMLTTTTTATTNSETEPSTSTLSLSSILDAVHYYLDYGSHFTTPVDAILRGHGMGFVGVADVKKDSFSELQSPTPTDELSSSSSSSSSSSFVTTPSRQVVMNLITTGLNSGRAVACVGPKGSGKSAMTAELARATNRTCELFSLFKDQTSRDLLLTRGTDEQGNTMWRKTPLTRAVENGTMVILDGIDKLSPDTLSSIARLLEQRQVDLPDGTRLTAHDDFACVALAHPPQVKRSWIAPEISGMFYWVQVEPLGTSELETVLSGLFPDLDASQLNAIVRLRDRLDEAVASGAADTMDEKESLVLSLRKMKHICKRVGRKGSDLAQLVRDALVTSLMPDREKRIVEACMVDCGIRGKPKDDIDSNDSTLDEELLARWRRTPSQPLLVPNPRFEENPGHAAVLRDLLDAHSVGERALLIMGYQGVGKNRVVDFLLKRLQCEREYLQLHRDTTVQSLLASPRVEDGRLVFEDSPLVRAAVNGRVLVVDEADKAPVEVVALLKGLIEDGELALPDGRVLRYEKSSSAPGQKSVMIHPDFRVWALANPAGYPFHGNDLAKEIADVFSCHTVPALDPDSQANILKSYGPGVPDKTIRKIIRIWQDLTKAHQKGALAYPFSIREAVSVVRHLAEYADDGLDGAIENVVAFDRFDPSLMKQLGAIFKQHGVQLPAAGTTLADRGREGGISTPRTRTLSPKHGKETTEAHVGGNQWAGGTGGSDTAGLGGRGGPYRLDLGHKVHQVSDEMKAEVSDEAKKKARAMAEAALAEKLKELNMGKGDWDRYENLRSRVEVQIQQLKVHLKDIKRRKEERVWLRRQSTGELDDSRIVDALAGEKDVFKRRGVAAEGAKLHALEGEKPMSVTLIVDVSASMYRFNGYDGRLERLLEATLMIMEALGDDERFKLHIVGHNGDNARIPLVGADTANDPATQLRVLETMVAHTQYTFPGDNTLEAMELALSAAHEDEVVLVVSDANLRRYRIKPKHVATLLQRTDVHAHLILIGSTGDEAPHLANAIPNGRAQVCADSDELPLLIKNILSSIAK